MRSEIKTDSSYRQNKRFKILILGRIMIISVIFTLFFAILDTLNLNHIGDIQAINNYLHAAFVLPAYYLFRTKKIGLTFAAHYFLFFCFLTSITAMLSADNDSYRAIWFFLSTMIAFIFTGQSFGKIYGYSSFLFIIFAGFILNCNLNSESILSILISLLVLILVMSAYTGHMEQHLNHNEQIQQELYYLANKSAISNTLTSDEHALRAEQLLKNAKELKDNFALIYIEIENIDALVKQHEKSFLTDNREVLINKLTKLVSSSDVVSSVNQKIIYIALPHQDTLSIRKLVDKIEDEISTHGIYVNGSQIYLSLCISVTILQPQDFSIRALHVRADKGLTKARSMGGSQIVFVDVN